MFEELLQAIGWKDYYNRWVWSEIIIDAIAVSAMALVAYFIGYSL